MGYENGFGLQMGYNWAGIGARTDLSLGVTSGSSSSFLIGMNS